jgi:hypothetical protein
VKEGPTARTHLDLGTLGLAEGGYLLLKRALRQAAPGDELVVTGSAPDVDVDLRAWCRAEGHRFEWRPGTGDTRGHAVVAGGHAETSRWSGAERARRPDTSSGDKTGDDAWHNRVNRSGERGEDAEPMRGGNTRE